MPYVTYWQEPEAAVMLNGFEVCYAYKNGRRLSYWYAVHRLGRSDPNRIEFDIRRVEGYRPEMGDDRSRHAAILTHAIKRGWIRHVSGLGFDVDASKFREMRLVDD